MQTVDRKEIDHFSRDSSHWWDANGPFKPLHKLNPTRLSYLKTRICDHFGRDEKSLKSYEGLSILDIGCGGGLVCEPLARLGGNVTGIDADENAIMVAREHAAQTGLSPAPTYLATDSGTLRQSGAQFDVVLALEIIEHVADVAHFVEDCAALCKPGGLLIFSTLNRTPQSYLLGKVAAEYVLGWVPKGTHDWQKFVKPSELSHALRQAGATPADLCGLSYKPLEGAFVLSPHDVAVNYFLSATRDA